MSDTIKIDTTSGGYYLGTSRSDDTISILVDKNDGHGRKLDYIQIELTPSNAKDIAYFLNEYANSMTNGGAL